MVSENVIEVFTAPTEPDFFISGTQSVRTVYPARKDTLTYYVSAFTILMIPFIVVSNLSFSELVAPGGLAVAAVFHNLVGKNISI